MTTTTGGTPYGVSHYSGMKDDLPISADEKELAIAQGVRVATVTRKLHQSEHC
jgi:NAD(P)H dehydrogenase (quinone)